MIARATAARHASRSLVPTSAVPPRTVHLTIAGMPGIHAVRAVFTAFAAVPGIRRADVTLGRATVEHDGTVTRAMIDEALGLVGCEVVEWREERGLPMY